MTVIDTDSHCSNLLYLWKRPVIDSSGRLLGSSLDYSKCEIFTISCAINLGSWHKLT